MSTSTGALTGWAPRTKLLRPRPEPAVVLDPALVASARGALERARLTLISGQAGAGKTTLAAALLEAAPAVPAAWISLDEGDDDLAALLHLLAGALAGVVPGGCPALADLLRLGLPAAADPRRAVGVLVNDLLAAEPPPFVLVLDDLHVLRDEAVVAALDYLIAYAPPAMRLLATARGDPPLALARLRARGQLHELRGDDLRLDVGRAEELLNGRLGLGLEPAEVERVVAATAGWAAGVRLLAQALARGAPAAELIERAGLADYLTEEVLRQETAHVRRFLLDTAVLDEVTPAAAAAVSGRPDAADMLAALHRRHHFLVGRAGLTSYHYHDVLGSFLRRRLAADGADRLAELHRRAAAAVQRPAARVEHLLAAGDAEAAAAVIEQLGRELFARPAEVGRLDAWVRRLPPAAAARPWITVIRGLAAAQRADLRPLLGELEAALEALTAADDYLGQWLAARLVHFGQGGQGTGVAVLARLETSPLFAELPVAARVDHHVSSAYGALYAGDWPGAARRLSRALELTHATGDVGAVEVLAQHVSPLLATAEGALDRVEAHAEWTARRFADPSPVVRVGMLHQRAFTLFMRGDFGAAREATDEARLAHERLGGGLPFVRYTLDWVDAAVAFARGDLAGTRALLERRAADPEIADIDRRGGAAYLALLARVLRAEGRIEALGPLVAEADARTAAAAYRGLPEVVRRSVRAQAAWAAGDLAGAAEALRPAAELEERYRLVAFAGSPRLDLAMVLLRMGRPGAALDELAAVLAATAGRGLVGLVAQAGAEVMPLLQLARERRVRPDDVAAVLAALAPPPAPAGRPIPGSAEVLSGRELEVLRLLATGASNRQLADALVLSENTVKTHVARVLAKLGVHSRAQAAARARELRLV